MQQPIHHVRSLTFIVSLFLLMGIIQVNTSPVEASCGSSSCFLNIGNQPGVQPKGTIRADINYSYVPQTGPSNRVAAVNLEGQEVILDEHQEFSNH